MSVSRLSSSVVPFAAAVAVALAACAEASRPLPELVDASGPRDAGDGDASPPDVPTTADTTSDMETVGDTALPDIGGPDGCADGALNGDESDVDCGGSCPRGCAIGDTCSVSADCASKRCVGASCQGLGCSIDADCPGDVPFCTGGVCVACAVAAHCDDANPCTEDICDLGECFAVERDGSCEDGFFCNGAETCVDGSCEPGTAPCGASMPCNEATTSCDECAASTDCGQPVTGAWSGCGGFGSSCAEGGTRTRDVTTPTCVDGACVNTTTQETEPCARDTDGQTCGAQQVGDWDQSCDAACGTVTRSREVTTPTCTDGACLDVTTTETDTCPGLSDGEICEDDGTYCGQPLRCHVCSGSSCVANQPHYDPASCLPSCGGAGALCGETPQCCPDSATCSGGELGPTWDCPKCCAGGCD